jgi:DNA-binding MarR family transcriptional regulator
MAVPDTSLTPDDPRLAAWRSFLEAHARLARRLDDELRAGHGISLAEYDALLQLARAPGRRLRMNQLADRVILSRSGITRLVDRLEAAGLVARRSCPTDARGAEAVLTEAGLERLRAAARTHLAGIERYFVSVVDPADLPTIERALGAVARRACPGGGAAVSEGPHPEQDPDRTRTTAARPGSTGRCGPARGPRPAC